MKHSLALIATLVGTSAFAQQDPGPQPPAVSDPVVPVVDPTPTTPATQTVPSLGTEDSTALLAFALAATHVDMTTRHSVGGGLVVNPDGDLGGAVTYNHTFNLNWAAGLSLATDGNDFAGGVHLTYSWD